MDVLEKIKQNGNQSAALLPEILEGGGVTLNLLSISFRDSTLTFEAGTDNIAKDILSALASGDKDINDIDVNLVLKPQGSDKTTAKMNVLSILGGTVYPGAPISSLIISFSYPQYWYSEASSADAPTFINLKVTNTGLTACGSNFKDSEITSFTIEYV